MTKITPIFIIKFQKFFSQKSPGLVTTFHDIASDSVIIAKGESQHALQQTDVNWPIWSLSRSKNSCHSVESNSAHHKRSI